MCSGDATSSIAWVMVASLGCWVGVNAHFLLLHRELLLERLVRLAARLLGRGVFLLVRAEQPIFDVKSCRYRI